jgi:hypothetical protein
VISSEVKMEDLSSLEKLLPSMLMNLVFARADKNVNLKTALYRRVYIRRVDKAVDKDREARNLILAQIEEEQRNNEEMTKDGRYIYMFKFVDHVEIIKERQTCVICRSPRTYNAN